MSDSKLNKKFHDAVRTGSRAAARRIRSSLKRMRMWQKAGLVLCVVFWISSVILGAVCRRTTGSLADQNAAGRWSADGGFAQISAFLAEGSGASEETVKAMYSGLMLDLQSDAIALSETQIENGASLIEECYCGMGSADLSVGSDSITVNAIGVGGDFFNFHPLDMIDGYYFADDDLMKDRILLDDQTAWRLFGSPNVVGMSVTIGGTPHFIAGVFRQPRERFYRDSGIGSYLVFMSYDSLCRYTETASVPEDGGGTKDADDMDSYDGMDAFAPVKEPLSVEEAAAGGDGPAGSVSGETLTVSYETTLPDETEAAEAGGADPAVPRTAAYTPENADDLPAKKGTLSETLGETGSDNGLDDSDDTGTEGETEEPPPDTDSKEEEELNDDPGGEDLGQSDRGSSRDSGNDEGQQREEVNRSRVTCYEAVIPNPVQGYALRKVRSRLEQVPFPMELATVVDNTGRYDILRLVTLVAQPGVRSMQIAPIRYPYWENVALAWEDVLIPYALLWMILRFSPLVFLLWLLIWYATHKSWTVGGIVRDIQDRIYDRQSERIYGSHSRDALSGAGAESIETDMPPDGHAAEENRDSDGVSAEDTAADSPDNAPGEAAPEENPDQV